MKKLFIPLLFLTINLFGQETRITPWGIQAQTFSIWGIRDNSLGMGNTQSLNSYKSKMAFWSGSLNFTTNKWDDKSGNPLNTPSLIHSYCLEGDGISQIIVTAYLCTQNTEVEILGKYNSLGTGGVLQGLYDGAGNCFFGITSGHKWWGGFGNKNITSSSDADLNWHIFKINKNGLYVDGLLKCDFTGYTFTNSSLIFQLLACNGVGTYNAFDISYIKIRENSVLVREYYCSYGISTKLFDYQKNHDISNIPNNWVYQNFYHYNLQYGFDVWQVQGTGEYLYLPLIHGTSLYTQGDVLTGYDWVAKFTQDGSQLLPCETKLNMPLTIQLKALDISHFWFNAGQTAANDIGYFDIAQIDFNYFNFTTKKDLVIATQAIPLKYFLQ